MSRFWAIVMSDTSYLCQSTALVPVSTNHGYWTSACWLIIPSNYFQTFKLLASELFNLAKIHQIMNCHKMILTLSLVSNYDFNFTVASPYIFKAFIVFACFSFPNLSTIGTLYQVYHISKFGYFLYLFMHELKTFPLLRSSVIIPLLQHYV